VDAGRADTICFHRDRQHPGVLLNATRNEFSIDIAWVLTVVLVAVRIGAAVALNARSWREFSSCPPACVFVLGLAMTLVAGLSGPMLASSLTMGHLVTPSPQKW